MSLAPWFLNTPTKAHKPQQNLKIQHCQDTPPSLQQCKLIFLCSFLTVSFVGLKKKNHFPFWVKASILLQPCGAYSPRLVHSRGPIKLPSVREQEHKVSCHQSHKVRAWQRIEYNLIALQQTN